MRKENEEAIEIIKTNCYFNNPLDFDNSIKINRALDMAIKALEEQPCEDCISRKSVLKHLRRYARSFIPFDTVWQEIKQLPLVKPQRPKAKIILVGNNPNFSPFDNSNKDILKCSNCLNKVLDSFMYCPMCGADMRGDTE